MAQEEKGQAVEQPEKTAMQLAQEAALNIINEQDGIEPEARSDAPAQPEREAGTEDQPKAAPAKTEEPPQPERYKFTVKAEDGSDVEIEEDIEGLKKGYMLEKSYRHKTAQLARQREAVETDTRKAIEDARKLYDEKLATAEKVIQESLAPELSGIDWAKLSVENPSEYVQRFQRVQAINSKLQEVQLERTKIENQRRTEIQANIKKQAQEAVEVLQTRIPSWSNDLYGKILKSAVENYGFKAEEVGAITDPRAIEVLHEAMQYRALKAKPVAEKRVPEQPKAVIKPGAGEKPEPNADKFRDAMAKLTKSGSRQDALEVARQLVERQAAGY